VTSVTTCFDFKIIFGKIKKKIFLIKIEVFLTGQLVIWSPTGHLTIKQEIKILL